MKNTTVMQCDRAFIKGNLSKTPEGFLVIEAVVTRPGVFTYLVDGKPHKRYAPPEVVLDADSYNTIKLKPVIAGHPYNVPGQMILPDITKEWSKGTVGETVYVDGQDVMCKFTVTDQQTIDRIESKELTELSCGYLQKIDWTPGVTPEGESYDSKQVARPMYNHLSLERHARVNNALIPGLDGIEVSQQNIKSESKNMAIITVNGVSHEVPDAFVPVYERLTSGLDASEKQVNVLSAERDVLAADKSKLEKELDEVKRMSLDAYEIQKQARELAGVLANVSSIGLDAAENASIEDMKKQVIGKVYPDIALDGKGAEYIDGVYDLAVKTFNATKLDKKTPSVKAVPAGDSADTMDEAQKARMNMYAVKGDK